MAYIDKNHIHSGLWWADHVLRGRNKFDHRVVQFVSSPSVSRLIPYLVPIKELRNLIRHTAHTTPPTMIVDGLAYHINLQCKSNPPIAVVDKLNIRIYIRPAPSASRNHGVGYNRHRRLALLQCSVGSDYQTQRNLGLVQHRRCGRNGIDGAPLV